MDYLSELTKAEQQHLCELIPVQAYLDFFQGSAAQFRKAVPGRNIQDLKPGEIPGLVQRNLDKEYFRNFLNDTLQNWLDETGKLLDDREKEGVPARLALSRVLPETSLGNEPVLYLKLARARNAAEAAAKPGPAAGGKGSAPVQTQSGAAGQEAILAMQRQLMTAVAAADEAEARRLETVRRSQEEKATLEEAISSLQDEMNRMQEEREAELEAARAVQAAMDQAKAAAVPADPVPAELPELNEYPFYSLCTVTKRMYNGCTLRRLGDVKGTVVIPDWLPDAPERWTLWESSNSLTPGTAGVWGWKTLPNYNPDKPDIVRSTRYLTLAPVEVCLVSGASTPEGIRAALFEGISFVPCSSKVLFACRKGPVEFTGILCRENQLTQDNGIVKVAEGTMSLPVYSFTQRDLLTGGGRSFHRALFLGMQDSMLSFRDPMQTVRDCIIQRLSWTLAKTGGFPPAEAQVIREFLSRVPGQSLYDDVAGRCLCTTEEAEKLVKDFTDQADKILSGTDMETGILSSALERSPELKEKSLKLGEELWKQDHQQEVEESEKALEAKRAELQEAQTGIDKIKKDVKSLAGEIRVMTEQRDSLQNQLSDLLEMQKNRDDISRDLEEHVNRRIEVARSNAEDFIAELAVLYPGLRMMASEDTAPVRPLPAASEFQSQPEVRPEVPAVRKAVFEEGHQISPELQTEIGTPKTLLGVLKNELVTAGVGEQYAAGLACWLYASFINRSQLLLCGPNGREIADAFSIAVFGETAAVLSCEGDWTPEAAEVCSSSGAQVVVLTEPLNRGWLTHLPQLLSQDRFFIAVHPFAEDLLIQPRGLYSYIQPVLTDLFVESRPGSRHAGGYLAPTFRHFQPGAIDARTSRNLVDSLAGVSPMARVRLLQVMSDMHRMLTDRSLNPDCMFGIFPTAYACGRGAEAVEALKGTPETDVSRATRRLLASYMGMEAEA